MNGSVTTAVILAAGRGTRLGAATESLPKALIPIAGKPVIVRVLDGLLRAGIEQIVIVDGYRADLLESELGNGAGSGVTIKYVRQEQLDGTARAMQLARPHLGSGRFFFAWADVVVDPANYRVVIRAARLADGAIAVNGMDDPSAGAAVVTEPPLPWPPVADPPSAFVTSLTEKPAEGASISHWNNAGFGVLGSELWPALERLEPSPRGEYELPAAIDSMARNGARIRAVPVEGQWFDIGTPETLESARSAFRD